MHQIEINKETGEANHFFVGETPWHGLGKRFEEAPGTVEEAIQAAGLDWTVEKRQLYMESPGEGGRAARKIAVPGAFATVRTSDESVLGTVGSRYSVLQNKDAFKIFQPFLDANEAEFHTAGSLYEGKSIWVMAKIKRPPLVVLKDDIVEKYIILSHGHDGFATVSFGLTPIRVVCNNTLTLSLKHQDSRFIKVRHTKKVAENLQTVSETINTADAVFEASADVYQRMAKFAVNAKSLEKFVRRVHKVDLQIANDKVHPITRASMNRLVELFESGRGTDIKGVKGTLWALYNAWTEYISWERGNSADSRLSRMWNSSAQSNNPGPRGFDAAVELLKAA